MATILGIDETKIAECVGLWLAEGDNKTIREITIARRLKELEREEFIERIEKDNRQTKWRKTNEGEKFMTTILGIDEAGNE